MAWRMSDKLLHKDGQKWLTYSLSYGRPDLVAQEAVSKIMQEHVASLLTEMKEWGYSSEHINVTETLLSLLPHTRNYSQQLFTRAFMHPSSSKQAEYFSQSKRIDATAFTSNVNTFLQNVLSGTYSSARHYEIALNFIKVLYHRMYCIHSFGFILHFKNYR